MTNKFWIVAALAAVTLGGQSARAVSAWDEAVDGDLSDLGLAPTPVSFVTGVNTVAGNMGRAVAGTPVDADIFTFTIDPGFQITGILLSELTPADTLNGGAFVAISAGTSINTTDPDAHLSNGLVSTPADLLAQLSAGPVYGGTGLPNPMPAGAYTFWIQETATTADYSLDFTVSAVPEPGSALALATPFALLLRRRRG